MSSRRRNKLAPNLFPFLAVLVCTLGTLILLLAMVAQNATQAAHQEVAGKPAAATPELDDDPEQPVRLTSTAVTSLIAQEEFRIGELVSYRDQQTDDLEQRREKLTHLEDHIRRVREQLQRLNDEVEAALGIKSPSGPVTADMVMLQEQIETERAMLEQLKTELETQTPRIVIVPHKGPNGTDRRPVYLECTQNGVTIWPEGSTVSLLQLEQTSPTANPLDDALRLIRYHALQTYGDSIPPYPLLVVRPDGIAAYSAARKAMLDWDDQFGYELVPASADLAYGRSDRELKSKVDEAIRRAALRQQRPVYAGRGVGGSSGRGKLPTLSAAKLERSARAHGYRPTPDPFDRDPNYFAEEADSIGSEFGAQSDVLGQMDQYVRDAKQELAAGSNAGQYADSGSPANRQNSRGETSGARNNSASVQANEHVVGSGAKARSGAAGNMSELVGSETNRDQRIEAELQSARQNGASGGSRSALGSTSDAAPGQGVVSDAVSGSHRDKGAKSQAHELAFDLTRSAETSPAGTHATGQGQDRGGQAQQLGAGIAAAPTSQSASAGSASGSGSGGPPPTEVTDQAPPPSANATISPDQAPAQLVQRQGRDWALPNRMQGIHGTKVVRSIRVTCYPDRYVLQPAQRGVPPRSFGYSDGDINRATLELATALRDRVQGWGASLPGGRWQPKLDVEVMPQAQSRFNQLRTLMNGSGIDVEQVPASRSRR